jgi:hypothetical protein
MPLSEATAAAEPGEVPGAALQEAEAQPSEDAEEDNEAVGERDPMAVRIGEGEEIIDLGEEDLEAIPTRSDDRGVVRGWD